MDKDDKILEDGMIAKAVEIEPSEVSESDLRKINKYTLTPLKAEDVFTFKTVIGDNETDDRNYEPFNLAAIKDLEKLYPGRTIIKDHRRSADTQIGRVYDTELITEPRLTKAGEPFTKIVAKNYMVRTSRNADLIKEIQAGIKKEVSTGVRPKRLICNICGSDNMKTYCPHWPGAEYDKEQGKTTCLMTIDGVKEAYELSLVAVPAQPRAGTVKHYGPKPPEDPDETKAEKTESTPEIEIQEPEIDTKDLELRALESFLFVTNETDNDKL